jgi:hypothetical protein
MIGAPPTLPRGTHPSGHDAGIVALLRWAHAHAAPFTAAELREDARFTMDALVLNRYVARADGEPIPQGWRPCAFVISPGGLAVLARADAAEPAATPAPAAKRAA